MIFNVTLKLINLNIHYRRINKLKPMIEVKILNGKMCPSDRRQSYPLQTIQLLNW